MAPPDVINVTSRPVRAAERTPTLRRKKSFPLLELVLPLVRVRVLISSIRRILLLSRLSPVVQKPGVKSEPELTWKSDEFARRLRLTLPRELGNAVGAPSWSDCSAERSKARVELQ